MIKYDIIKKSNFRTIASINYKGKNLVQKFLDDLERDNKSTFFKIFSGFEMLCEKDFRNKSKFRMERKDIWAIKANEARIYCFFDGNQLLLCATALLKKNQKNSKKEKSAIKKCCEIRKIYMEGKNE